MFFAVLDNGFTEAAYWQTVSNQLPISPSNQRVMTSCIGNMEMTHQAIEMYRFRFALVCVFTLPFPFASSIFLFFPLLVPVSAGLSVLEDWC